jgi:hypothetical protein
MKAAVIDRSGCSLASHGEASEEQYERSKAVHQSVTVTVARIQG